MPKIKSMNKKAFVIDLDGTICNFSGTFISTAYALSMIEKEDMDALDTGSFLRLSDCGIISEDDETKICGLMSAFHAVEHMEIFPGAKEFLFGVMQAGDYIVYLTSRKENLRDQTVRWLARHQLPMPSGDIGNLNNKTALIMNDIREKSECLRSIVNFHSDYENKVIYVENDPNDVEASLSIKNLFNIFTFKYSYCRYFEDARITYLETPDNSVYHHILRKVYKK